ncbi:MAG: recQ 1 [Cyanobacteria bacterium RYN_339]|nr:recQ 1 [Cyanobacteria bacterium RYN_339]
MPIETLAPPSLEAELQRHFGLGTFREGQRDVIDSLLAGRSTLAVMPTGRGKSLCYQLPALLLPGVTLVVSPLIALMKDQVDALAGRGIPATFINSSLDPEEQTHRIDQMARGGYRLVYVAPERFRHRAFLEGLARTQVSLLAIDEAHCLSQWGHDFRPDYLRLGAAIAACQHPPVLAATATATPEVRQDIVAQLGLVDPLVVVSGFDRPNLRYVVRYAPSDEQKLAKLGEVLGKVAGSAVVYAATRRNVEAVTDHLTALGVDAVAYHAGLRDDDRAYAQDQFMTGQARVVVATNAFGMGIDKPDVRAVIHFDLPGTLEAYYQEAGRAGRDGHAAYCVLLFSPADRYLQEFFIEGACPRPDTIRGVYDVLAGRTEEEIYLSHEAINRQLPSKTHDMAIGTCLNLLERAGLIERGKKGVAIAHVRLLDPAAQSPRSAAQQAVLDALRADPQAKAGTTPELGVWAEALGVPREALNHALVALRQKEAIDYAPPARTRSLRVVKRVANPLAELDEAFLAAKQGRELGKLERMVAFAYERVCRRNAILAYFGEALAGTCGRCDACNNQADRALLGEQAGAAHPALFETLRGLRAKKAREADVPAYKIFPDAALEEMAAYLPASYDQFLAIKGVGPEKLTRHGDEFLGAILAFRELNPHLVPGGAPKPLAKKPRPRRSAEPSAQATQPPPVDARRARMLAEIAALYRDGLAPETIAERTLRSVSTIEGHLLSLVDLGEIDVSEALSDETRAAVLAAAERHGRASTKILKDALPDDVTYFQIQLTLHQA